MSNKPSVALVSRSNALGGGASRIAEELGEWLRDAGSNVAHYCASAVGPLKDFQVPLHPPGVFGKLVRVGHRFTRKIGLNDLIPTEFFATLSQVLRDFDVVHFHDLHSAISPLTLQLCSRKKAVVLTAHDCSCFTGGCVYPLQCERFLKSCGYCPQLPAIGACFDLTSINLRINRWLARQDGIRYVFPSRWLYENASRSLRFAREPKVIHNGFLPAGYDFRPKSQARWELGIRDERKVVIVAAHYLADPRKGIAFALAAIRAISDLNPLVIFVGHPPSDIEVRMPGVCFWLSGFVSDKRKLGLLLAASDVFLFPSLEDNLPIMVQEAMAAGTSVVGFAAGGIPEMIDDCRTGRLSAVYNQGALNENLRKALTCDDLSQFGRAAKEVVNERFRIDEFGEKHLQLYEEVTT